MDLQEHQLLSSFHEAGGTTYGKVVDMNSSVIGLNNLSIVGPSVLPVMRWASPFSLTVCMLSRLRDYIGENTHGE